MAPETIDGATPDDRADVYATGVVLYELLFGRPPLDGGSVLRMRRASREEPLAQPSAVPEPLWAVLAAMLTVDPARRPSAADAAGALGRLPPDAVPADPFAPVASAHVDHPTVREAGPGPSAEDPEPRRRRRRRAAVVVVLALAVIGGVVAVRAAGRGSSAPSRAGEPSPRARPRSGTTSSSPRATAPARRTPACSSTASGSASATAASPARPRRWPCSRQVHSPRPWRRRRCRSTSTAPLANRPRDGSTFREWSARRRGAPPVYFVAAGGTALPTDAAGIRRIGRDPGRAVLVPRYAFDRFARTPPADGTLLRLGDATYLVRRGRPPPRRGVPGSPRGARARLRRAPGPDRTRVLTSTLPSGLARRGGRGER